MTYGCIEYGSPTAISWRLMNSQYSPTAIRWGPMTSQCCRYCAWRCRFGPKGPQGETPLPNYYLVQETKKAMSEEILGSLNPRDCSKCRQFVNAFGANRSPRQSLHQGSNSIDDSEDAMF